MVRTLEEVCKQNDGAFCEELLGIKYCMLAPTEDRIECFYRADSPDHNEFFRCHNPEYGDLKKVVDDIDSVYIEHTKEGNA